MTTVKLPPLEEHNAVEFACDGNIILVGEDHDSPVYRQLAKDALRRYEPPTVSIERSRVSSTGKCAIGETYDYAERTGATLLAVDTHWRKLAPPDATTDGIYGHINRVSVGEDGVWDEDVKWESRRRTIERYGDWTRYAIWEQRERDMAGRLLYALNKLDDDELPILHAGGFYHLEGLKARLDDPVRRLPIEVGRVMNDD